MANLKIMEQFNNYNFIGVNLVILSILTYFLIFYVENLEFLDIEQVIGIFAKTMSHPITYFILLFCFLQAVTVDKMFLSVRQYIESRFEKKEEQKKVSEKEYYERIGVTSETSLSLQKGHSGYAYSEENNPNPQLLEIVRKGTMRRLTKLGLTQMRTGDGTETGGQLIQ